MAINQKHVFWEALVIAIFIFGAGLFIGLILEENMAKKSQEMYISSEMNLLDIKAMSDILSYIDVNCKLAIEQNAAFGDRIYEDANKLGEYEDAAEITDDLTELHRKYDLLRTIFWINSVKIKNKCGDKFHTVVYLYDYNTEETEEKSKQFIFSKFGKEIKQEFGNEVILIPIAKDLEIDSLDLLMKNYNVNQTGFFVDERKMYSDISDLDSLRNYLRA